MGDMDAYRDIFLSESAEYIQAIVDGLLTLEDNPNDLEPVETVFRGAHSLKGMSATMGYERTADLTHKMESLMDTVRKREQAPDHTLTDLMLEAIDVVKSLIEAESSGHDLPDTSDIVTRLIDRAERKAPPEGKAPKRATKPAAAQPAGEAAAEEAPAEDEAKTAASTEPVENILRVRVQLEPECVLKSVRAYMVIKRLSHLGTVIETQPSARDIEDEQFDDAFEVVLRSLVSAGEVAEAARFVSEVRDAQVLDSHPYEPAPVAAPEAKPAEGSLVRAQKPIAKLAETQTVRISIGHLDNMVNLVGELVILRSRLEAIAKDIELKPMLDALEELRQISGELQHEVMQTRMVPVGNIFNRFPRMVRDLARDLGKEVGFVMDGLDIELDRTVLDEIGDPIVHLLRNAVDHGIESAEERAAQGKPEKGCVRLIATRERDSVQIIVSDDGGGMAVDRIWAKACDRGMVEVSRRDEYDDEQILMFTCTPGFSTSETATKVSGRGVGMDVVRGKIEYLGGSLFIRSTPGEGSEFVLTLPLTLAIIQALLVGSHGQVFAVPLGSVAEVLSPEEAHIDTVDGKPVTVLRDESVAPLYRLPVILGVAGDSGLMPTPGEHVVLIESGTQTRALAVDSLIGRQEIVIKPLGRMFRQIRGLGGATVLGDGRVALILDPRTLFSMGDQS
jgi:two-component system, chemotaxis family, sensor kinase CheA